MIHLDTNFVIVGLRPGTPEDLAITRWIAAGKRLAIAAPAWAEFLCGPVSSAEVHAAQAALGAPIDFTTPDAELAAQLYNAAGRRRSSLVDCMIAAVAIRHGAELATANRADFDRFTAHGLQLTPG